jgi:hypothetical protein
MWLLDVNMPRQLVALLESEGIKTDTATVRGWGNLSNGALLEAAAAAGFPIYLDAGQAVWRIILARFAAIPGVLYRAHHVTAAAGTTLPGSLPGRLERGTHRSRAGRTIRLAPLALELACNPQGRRHS